MKNVLGWTLTDGLTHLDCFQLTQEDRPEEFRNARFGTGDRTLVIESDGWLVEGGKLKVKYTRLQSQVADVATLMLYPTTRPDLLPVFAAEWVVVGKSAHVLVLDVEIAGPYPDLRRRLHPLFQPLAAVFQTQFPPVTDRPAWFEEIAEPWHIFSNASVEALPQVRGMFQAYLAQTVTHCYLPILERVEAGPDHPEVTQYKHHHALHSPGVAMVKPKAGEEWTREFFLNWHFGP